MQNNFIKEFQTKIPADLTVLNKSKMAAIYNYDRTMTVYYEVEGISFFYEKYIYIIQGNRVLKESIESR